ncbi:MAG: tandem-95 repeat protein [Myxococcales bacterium]|nr:tandem-95 repeat protein [Myxococcales bacterium]
MFRISFGRWIGTWGVFLFCALGLVTKVWANPTFVSSPTLRARAGETYRYLVRVWRPDRPQARVEVRLKSTPTWGDFRLVMLGRSGCCVWNALLSGHLSAEDAQKKGDITLEALDVSEPSATTTQQFSLQVAAKNNPPHFSEPTAAQREVRRGEKYSFSPQVQDADHTISQLTIELLEGPKGMVWDAASGSVTWQTSLADVGAHGVVFRAVDLAGGVGILRYVLDVKDENIAPAFVSTPLTGASVGEPYVYQLRAKDPDPQDSLLYTLKQGPAGMRLHSTGLLVWEASAAAVGSQPVVVEVTDRASGGLVAQQSWSLNVVSSNQRPYILSQAPLEATQGVVYRYLIQASDADTSDTLRFVLEQGPSNAQLQVKDSRSAEFSWTPSAEEVGLQTLVLRVDDGRGGVAWEHVTIRVQDVNDPPVFSGVKPLSVVVQGQPYRVQLVAKDPDKGASLRYIPLTLPTGMRLDSETGWLFWTPDASHLGKAQEVEVTVQDEQGLRAKDSLRFSVRVVPAELPPVFSPVPPSFSLVQGQTWRYQLIATSSHPNKPKLFFRIEEGPVGVQLNETTGELLWTPTATEVGKQILWVDVYDDFGRKARLGLVFDVTPEKQAPVIDTRLSTAPIGATVGALYTFQPIVRDPNGDKLRFSLERAPSGMTINEETGWISWLPKDTDADQTYKFSWVARDPLGLEAKQEVSLKVYAKNQAPTMISETLAKLRSLYKAPARKAWELLLPSTADADQDQLSYLLEDAPEGVTLHTLKETSQDLFTGRLSWTPTLQQVGLHNIKVRVEDGRGGVVRFRITVEVVSPETLGALEQPVIYSEPPLQGYVGISWRYLPRIQEMLSVAGTWTFSLGTGTPSEMKVDAQSGLLTWTPKETDIGASSTVVLIAKKEDASKKTLFSIEQSFVLRISARESLPTTQISWPASAEQDKMFSLPLWPLTSLSSLQDVRLISGPAGLEVGPYSGVMRWSPSAANVGQHPIVLQVAGVGSQTTLTGTLDVKDRNDVPRVLSLPWLGAVVGSPLNAALDAEDSLDFPPDNPLLWSLWQAPAGASFASGTYPPTLAWSPNALDVGRRLLVWEVEDQRGAKAIQASILSVVSQNQSPSWTQLPAGSSTPIKLTTGQSWKSSVAAVDPDGDKVFYRLASAPAGMSLAERNGELLWVPRADQQGSFTVEIQAVDERGAITSFSFTFDVSGGTDAGPSFLSTPPVFAMAGEMFQYVMRVQDPNDAVSTLRFTLAQAPSGMTLDAQKQTLSWAIPSTTSGLFSVSVVVSDGSGLTTTQSFLLSVFSRVETPKIISTPPSRASEGVRLLYQVQLSQDTGSFFRLVQAPMGMDIHAQSGVVSWVPSAYDARVREHTIEIEAFDTMGRSATQQFTLVVDERNAPPRFISPICPEAVAGQNYSCVIKVEDLDRSPTEKGSWLFFRLLFSPSGMTIPASTQGIRLSDGSSVGTVLLEWSPKINQVGTYPIIVEVRDSDGATALLEFSLSVAATQKGPIAHAGEDRKGIPPQEIELDGSGSLAPEESPESLQYLWSCRQNPGDEKVEVTDATARRARVILRRAGDYLFQLIVRTSTQESLPDLVEISVRNVPPNASVDAPLRVETLPEGSPRKIYTLIGHVGQEVSLDGQPSDDANGDPLRFSWTQLRKQSPDELPAVEIKGDQQAKASFTPNAPGVYRFQLRVEDIPAQGDIPALQSVATVEVIVHDPSSSPPLYVPFALITAPEQGVLNEAIRMDGSRSSAANGKIVGYQWRLLTPSDQVRLDVDAQKPYVARLTSSIPGYYLVALVVESEYSGKKILSQEQVVGVRIDGQSETNRLPFAIADSKHVTYETWAQLDATQSLDPSGSQLSFRWVQIDGPTVALLDEKTARPSFFVLRPGDYRFRLWVRGRSLSDLSAPESPPIDILVRANEKDNQPPVAMHSGDLFGDNSLKAGIVLSKGALDASPSTDPEKATLLYRWRYQGGFPTKLQDAQTATPFLVPITGGVLRWSLEVFDGKTWSLPVEANLAVDDDTNQVPVAHAGSDKTIRLGQTVRLDGSKSYDKDTSDVLTFHWRLIEPQGYAVLLNTAEPMTPSFTATDSKITKYVFGLRVDDGKVRSIESRVQILVSGLNQPPIAQIETLGEVFVGQEVLLDGSKSYDPDREKLTYRWKQLEGKTVNIADWNTATLSFRVESEGTYAFQLQVSDESGASSAPDTITFRAKEKSDALGCSCRADSSSSSPILPLFFLFIALFLRRRLTRTMFSF